MPYYNDSLCLHMNLQEWLISKESGICSERKSWNDFYFSAESVKKTQNFYACARAKKKTKKKRCRRDISLIFRLV